MKIIKEYLKQYAHLINSTLENATQINFKMQWNKTAKKKRQENVYLLYSIYVKVIIEISDWASED